MARRRTIVTRLGAGVRLRDFWAGGTRRASRRYRADPWFGKMAGVMRRQNIRKRSKY